MFKTRLKIKIPPLRKLLNPGNLKHYFTKFIGLKASPHKLAWSVAIGIFIGFFIPIGFQTFFIIPLAIAFEVNIIVAYISTLVSNPITAIPIYYVAVQIGEKITGIQVLWSNFEKVFLHPSYDSLINLGSDSLVVFFTGTLFMGLVFSALLYFVTYKMVVYYRKLHNIELH